MACASLWSALWSCYQLLISPTHKRAEGRTPLWGSELTSKDANLQEGSSRNRCWAERKTVDFDGRVTACLVASYRFLAQSSF